MNGNWSNTSNWAGGVIPVNGDDVAFPAASTVLSTTNDIVSLPITMLGTMVVNTVCEIDFFGAIGGAWVR